MGRSGSLTYSDDEGPKALIAGEITFYFNRIEDRSGLVEAYALAMKHVGPHARWYRTEAMSRPKKMTPEVYEFLAVWLKPGAKLRKEYELTLTSGESPDLVGPWGLRFGVEPDLLPEDAGFFEINVPREMPTERSQELRGLALQFADLIDFRSGHAGFGVQYDEGDLDDERDARIGAWCRRYLGVDYRDFAASCEFMGDSIKGVSWQTFLDSAFAAALGGVEALRAKASPILSINQCKHGLCLQAGAVPILGDKNKREDIDAYKEVFKIVEPIVVKEDLALPGFDDDASLDWVNRFE